MENSHPKTNRLLATLEPEDYDAVMQDAKIVSLKFRKRLFRQDQPVDAVYFPIDTIVALLVTIDGKAQTQMAVIGREGVVGASELILTGGGMGLNLIQLAGAAVRINANAFRKVLSSRPLVDRLIHQHLYALIRQILQGAVCNRIHSMEERCARWLLMNHDRAGQDTLPVTQEFLSRMLGARRASINVATGIFKRAGFIRYVRGKMTVIDRVGLESASCECYQAIVRIYDDLLNGKHEAPPSYGG